MLPEAEANYIKHLLSKFVTNSSDFMFKIFDYKQVTLKLNSVNKFPSVLKLMKNAIKDCCFVAEVMSAD